MDRIIIPASISSRLRLRRRSRHLLFLTVAVSCCVIVIRRDRVLTPVELNYGVDCTAMDAYLSGSSDAVPNVTDLFVSLAIDGENGIHDHVKHRPLLNCLEADSEYLIDQLKKDYLVQPSPGGLELKEEYVEQFRDNHQSFDVYEMVFKDRVKNGFFLEAGAAFCEGLVSEPFRRHLNWTGLLVEAVPVFFKACLEKQLRRATLMKSCVGTNTRPHFIDFDLVSTAGLNSGVPVMPGFAGKNPSPGTVKLQCFPLYSLLLAMGGPTVNLLVLDIEGFELAVLRTVPWAKVDIEVLTVETDLAGRYMDGSREEIIQLMTEAGYARFNHRNDVNRVTGTNQNDLFVRKDIVDKYNVVQL